MPTGEIDPTLKWSDANGYIRKDATRCVICDWPLAETADRGCVPHSCSFRPDHEHYRQKTDKRHEMLRAVTAALGGDKALAETAMRAMLEAM